MSALTEVLLGGRPDVAASVAIACMMNLLDPIMGPIKGPW
jgi:hypothetical protein